MRRLVHYLEDLESRSVLHSMSSLDTYSAGPDASILHAYTEADLIELARVFDRLDYPGTERADAVVQFPEGSIFFRCVDSVKRPPVHPYSIMNFLYDPGGMKYLDPLGVYRDVRDRRLVFTDEGGESEPEGGETPGDDGHLRLDSWSVVTDAAVVLSRFSVKEDFVTDQLVHAFIRTGPEGPVLSPGARRLPVLDRDGQRELLLELLSGPNPKAGFRALRRTGFVDAHWPELASMYGVGHSKEHHPEGNVWEHTLETFEYRKTTDMALSLGLLFHDAGKPHAQAREGRRFDKHSQIGAGIAGRFLARLGFDQGLIKDVVFLVRQHMLPSVLPELPTFRVEDVMSSQLFPLLLELYRCDLSSTYRGPDGYYRACKVYRSYLKNVRNPFRTSDGKKILRTYVER